MADWLDRILDVSIQGKARSEPAPASILSLSPSSGIAGTPITIFGNGLGFVQSVRFNGVSAIFSIIDSTQIRALVPLGCRTGKITATPLGQSPITGPEFRETLDYITRQLDTSPVTANVSGAPLYVGDLEDLFQVEMAQAMTCAGYDFEASYDSALPPSLPDPSSFATFWQGRTALDTEYTPPFRTVGLHVAGSIGKVYYPAMARATWVRYTPRFDVTNGAYQLYIRGIKRP